MDTLKAIDLTSWEQWAAGKISAGLLEQLRLLLAVTTDDDLYVMPVRVKRPSVTKPLLNGIRAVLDEIVAVGVTNGRQYLEPFISVAVDWGLADREAARWARQYSFELVKGINDTTAQRLQVAVSEAIENGEGVYDLGRRLRGVDGAFGANRADAIAITETTRAHAQGQITSAQTAGAYGTEWMTANDEIVRKCPICWPNHEQVRAFGDPFPSGHTEPPGHPRCRCYINIVWRPDGN